MEYNSIKLGNNELMDYMIINDVRRGISTGMTNTTENSSGDGASLLSSNLSSKTIEVDFTILKDLNETKRIIGKFTGIKQLQRIIFSDEPNLFWEVIIDGEIKVTEHNNGKYTTGTLIFLVPSGEAESVDTKVLNESNSGGELGTITHNADGSTKVIINNKGSLETFPKIKVTNVHENGYLGFVNPIGILELGKREEADGETVKESQILYTSDSDSQFSKLVDTNAENPQTSSVGMTCDTSGKISYSKDGLRLTTPSTVTGKTLRGGMKVFDLPPDSNGEKGAVNFYAWFNILAHALEYGQTGVLQILFTDKEDNLVAGYGVVKTDMVGNVGNVKFWVGGDKPREWKSLPFTANDGEAPKDPNNNTQFNSKTGWHDFVKQKGALSFHWKGSRQTINVPELAEVPIERIYVFIGNWSGSNKFIGDLSLRRFWCRKDYVSVWNDLPNRYQTGSVIELDMENGKLIKDGIAINNELVTGSKFFSFPPGESELDIYQSPWNTTPPQVEIEMKERYL
ncbi:distal tail protein Dit [Lactococcus lactis]|uniref:Phage-related protein n=1 Tax=Lactococcus lactis subsp. lactis TaxID=1360 RepID=A0A2N5WB11_LACLL|nr:distal tail protein Dit [Lactococcus lactis]PLW59433.1 Phage-related protein [Lactococcus lactis subsp. lactis]